jgi:predicted acylesterase/phospholipase RssA
MKALVFSTGGAHLTTMLGMLEELLEKGDLKGIDSFAGISAGAILAAFCATRPIELAIQQLRDIMVRHYKDAIKPHYRLLNVPLSALFQESLLDDSGLKQILEQELDGKALRANLFVGLTNETDMQYEMHSFFKNGKKGDMTLSKAVHASASIPVVLKGEDLEEKHYSDGGVFHQIPVLAIEKMFSLAKTDTAKHLDLTIVSSSTWKYRPEAAKESKLPYLAKKTMHFLDCTNYNNLSSDREILRQAIQLYDGKVGFSMRMFSVPSEMLRKLHKRFSMDKIGHMSEEDIAELQTLGRNIVKANCATYDILQDEPSPVLKF